MTVSRQVPFFNPAAEHLTDVFSVLHFSVFRVPLLTATAVYFTPRTRVNVVVREFFVVRVLTPFGLAGLVDLGDSFALNRTRIVGLE